VNLNGGTGNGRLATTNGFINVKDHQGVLDLKTAHGAIIVKGGAGRLDMKTERGEIDIRATKADVMARSARGDIRFEGTPGDGQQSFDSENGNIILALPATARFRVDAQAGNGTVTNVFSLTTSAGAAVDSRTRLKGSVGGDSSTSIRLRSQKGNIVLKRLTPGSGKAEDSRQMAPPGRLVDVGGYRLHLHCAATNSKVKPPFNKLPGEAQKLRAWLQTQPRHDGLDMLAEEMAEMHAARASAKHPLGDIPLLVLSSGVNVSAEGERLQADLTTLHVLQRSMVVNDGRVPGPPRTGPRPRRAATARPRPPASGRPD
jgi:hypothetical protein